MNLDQYKTEEPREMEYECPECGRPIEQDKYCSNTCFKASLI